MIELAVLLGTLAVAGALGLTWRARQGRVRQGRARRSGAAAGVVPAPVRARLNGSAVTLLMLSAPVCAQCPQARAVLGELAAATDGLRHAEFDLAEYPELAADLGVRSTPTVLALDAAGRELFRVVGVPRRADLLAAVAPHL